MSESPNSAQTPSPSLGSLALERCSQQARLIKARYGNDPFPMTQVQQTLDLPMFVDDAVSSPRLDKLQEAVDRIPCQEAIKGLIEGALESDRQQRRHEIDKLCSAHQDLIQAKNKEIAQLEMQVSRLKEDLVRTEKWYEEREAKPRQASSNYLDEEKRPLKRPKLESPDTTIKSIPSFALQETGNDGDFTNECHIMASCLKGIRFLPPEQRSMNEKRHARELMSLFMPTCESRAKRLREVVENGCINKWYCVACIYGTQSGIQKVIKQCSTPCSLHKWDNRLVKVVMVSGEKILDVAVWN